MTLVLNTSGTESGICLLIATEEKCLCFQCLSSSLPCCYGAKDPRYRFQVVFFLRFVLMFVYSVFCLYVFTYILYALVVLFYDEVEVYHYTCLYLLLQLYKYWELRNVGRKSITTRNRNNSPTTKYCGVDCISYSYNRLNSVPNLHMYAR